MHSVGTPTSELFRASSTEVRQIADVLRGLARASLPEEAHEIVYHGALGYGPSASPSERFLYIAPQRAYVNLGFFYGANLPDAAGIIEGSGARMRHVKVRDLSQARHKELPALVLAGWDEGIRGLAGLHERMRRRD